MQTFVWTSPYHKPSLFEQCLQRLDEVERLATGLSGEPSPEALQLGSCFVRGPWLPWTSERHLLDPRQVPKQSLDVLVPQRREGQASCGQTPYQRRERSEERRVGKECRSRWSPY